MQISNLNSRKNVHLTQIAKQIKQTRVLNPDSYIHSSNAEVAKELNQLKAMLVEPEIFG